MSIFQPNVSKCTLYYTVELSTTKCCRCHVIITFPASLSFLMHQMPCAAMPLQNSAHDHFRLLYWHDFYTMWQDPLFCHPSWRILHWLNGIILCHQIVPLPFNDELSFSSSREALLSVVKRNLPWSHCMHSCVRAKEKVGGKGRQPFKQYCGLPVACTGAIFGSDTLDRIVY